MISLSRPWFFAVAFGVVAPASRRRFCRRICFCGKGTLACVPLTLSVAADSPSLGHLAFSLLLFAFLFLGRHPERSEGPLLLFHRSCVIHLAPLCDMYVRLFALLFCLRSDRWSRLCVQEACTVRTTSVTYPPKKAAFQTISERRPKWDTSVRHRVCKLPFER